MSIGFQALKPYRSSWLPSEAKLLDKDSMPIMRKAGSLGYYQLPSQTSAQPTDGEAWLSLKTVTSPLACRDKV